MTTKAEMDAQRAHYLNLIQSRDQYRLGVEFTTLEAAKWIGRDQSVAIHYLEKFEQQGYLTKAPIRPGAGKGTPLKWRKAGTNLMREPFRTMTDEEIGIEPVAIGRYWP